MNANAHDQDTQPRQPVDLATAGRSRPDLPDFSAAFLIVAAAMLPAAWLARRLPRSAGEEMSGHHEAPG